MVHRRVLRARAAATTPRCRCATTSTSGCARRATFRFRHVAGGPVIRYRRHGAQLQRRVAAGPRARARSSRRSRSALADWPLRRPRAGVDWAVLPQPVAERRARLVLADAFAGRGPAGPGGRAARARRPSEPRAVRARRRPTAADRAHLVRLQRPGRRHDRAAPTLAKELAPARLGRDRLPRRRAPLDGAGAYAVREWERGRRQAASASSTGRTGCSTSATRAARSTTRRSPSAFAEAARPRAARRRALPQPPQPRRCRWSTRPPRAASATLFSTHNYWLDLPAQLPVPRPTLELCDGPGDGGRDCAACVGSRDADGYAGAATELRERFALRRRPLPGGVRGRCARTLVDGRLDPAEMIDVLPPGDARGRRRSGRRSAATAGPGRRARPLVVGFVGSAYPHKGPQLLVEAAQRADWRRSRVRIHGEVSPTSPRRLARARPPRRRRAVRRATRTPSCPASWPGSTPP